VIRYLIRRILYAIPILLGVMLLTFAMFFLVSSPDSLARRNLSSKNPTQAQIHEWLAQHGYDKPAGQQFEGYMENLLLFQFGKSDRTKEPIADRLRAGVLPSLQVASMVLLTALISSLTLAMVSAYFRGTYVDKTITLLCVAFLSISYVFYVITMQFLLGKVLRYGPLAGYQPGFESWRFVIIPMIIGVTARIGGDIRLYRTFLLDEINQDYVRTARAKGVREHIVLFKHVLKNSLVPVITTSVSLIPMLILGSIILESFFGIPGIGSYLQDAISNQDFAVIRALVYLGTVLYIVGFIATDLLYAVVDPRVRLE
jgi:peptide/nickel transport system permease protein